MKFFLVLAVVLSITTIGLEAKSKKEKKVKKPVASSDVETGNTAQNQGQVNENGNFSPPPQNGTAGQHPPGQVQGGQNGVAGSNSSTGMGPPPPPQNGTAGGQQPSFQGAGMSNITGQGGEGGFPPMGQFPPPQNGSSGGMGGPRPPMIGQSNSNGTQTGQGQ